MLLGSHCWATNHTIMQWLRLHTHPKLLAHQCGAHKVFEPLHMQWMGIWNHRQPVTIALVVPDFDSCRLKAWVTLLGYKPYHNAVVEAPYPSKAACASMWSTYKVYYEPIHMQWMGLGNHRQPVTIALVVPDFDSRLKARVLVTAGLQTIPLCPG